MTDDWFTWEHTLYDSGKQEYTNLTILAKYWAAKEMAHTVYGGEDVELWDSGKDIGYRCCDLNDYLRQLLKKEWFR